MIMHISILIPCFNAEKWIARSIESALAQTWPDKEVIVVDDGSTDGSVDIIRSFEGRIRWDTGPNRGGGAARDHLLMIARGEWLQYLDADDVLLPEKIARQAEFLEGHPDCDIVCSPTIEEYMKDGRLVQVERHFPEPLDPWILLALWHLPQTGGPLWRRSALRRVGGWRVGQPCCQEHELYFRLLEGGCRFEFCDSCLAVYRNWNHGRRVTVELHGEVVRQRIVIFDRIENCLRERNELTPLRQRAVNDARLALARGAWSNERAFSLNIMRRIVQSDPSYCPSAAPASPPAYRLAYRLFGFRGAEYIAQSKRALEWLWLGKGAEV
jgi:glycosyltransferase involved in cell wall biosynthesis